MLIEFVFKYLTTNFHVLSGEDYKLNLMCCQQAQLFVPSKKSIAHLTLDKLYDLHYNTS